MTYDTCEISEISKKILESAYQNALYKFDERACGSELNEIAKEEYELNKDEYILEALLDYILNNK